MIKHASTIHGNWNMPGMLMFTSLLLLVRLICRISKTCTKCSHCTNLISDTENIWNLTMTIILSGLCGEMILLMNDNRITRTSFCSFITTIALIFISIFILSGCGVKKIMEETRLSKEVKKESTQVFDYLKNEDIKSLSDLFCQNQKDNSDIKEKWKNFYESIDGKILAYDKLSCTETMRTFSDGKLTYLVFRIEYSDVKN